MGMSDEKEQFRRLFSEDELLHESLKNENIAVDSPEARGPLGKPDNWLVGRLWLNHGYDIVDSGVKIRRQTPLNFYETGPKWRLKHAESIESEGVLDQRAQNAWLMASDDWASFGQRSIPTTSSFTIKLGELDILKAQRSEKIEQFRMLNQEVYDAARDELIEALPDEFKAFYDLPSDQLTFEQRQILPSILDGLIPNLKPIAKSAQDDATRLASVNLIDEIANLNERILKTNGYRTQINYPYWEALALAEQEERTVEARRLIYEAEKANAAAELDESIRLYEEAFAIWEKIFDDYPLLTLDDTAEDLFDSIRRYMVVTDSEEIPEDFPLIEFAMMMGELGRIDSRDYQRIREEGLEQVMQDRLNSQEIAPGIEGDSSQNIPSSEGIPQPVAVEQPQDVSLPQGADK